MITSAVMPARSRPYFSIDVLNHFLAPLVLEIDVDIGRFVALAADEPLEEHIHPIGIDGSDAQAIADRRVGRRPRPWQRIPRERAKTHQIPHGEKIGFVVQLGDQLQFVLEQLPHFARECRPDSARALPPR